MTHKANGSRALDQRRQDAKGRLIERNERGTDGQIRALDKRLGEGVGAKRERHRLSVEPTSKEARKTRRGKKASK